MRGRNLAKENEKRGNSGTRVKHATRDHARGSVSEKDRNARNPKKERGTGQGKKKNLKKATEEVAAEIGHRIDEREGNQGIRKTVPLRLVTENLHRHFDSQRGLTCETAACDQFAVLGTRRGLRTSYGF